MEHIEKSIEVNVPVRTAYNQWTQFEQFPQFMEGVEEVRQLDDKRLQWRASIAGKTEEWQAEIVEQTPDGSWPGAAPPALRTAAASASRRRARTATRITLRLDYDPEGMVETTGDKLGFVSRRVEGDLERFKDFIEESGCRDRCVARRDPRR